MIQNSNPLTFSIKPDEAHVWIFDLNELGIGSIRWEQFLSKEELIKANSYTFDRDRQNFVARRGILRNLIARYTKLDLANIKYSIDPYGKLENPRYF